MPWKVVDLEAVFLFVLLNLLVVTIAVMLTILS
jgi:hypothetical protein